MKGYIRAGQQQKLSERESKFVCVCKCGGKYGNNFLKEK